MSASTTDTNNANNNNGSTEAQTQLVERILASKTLYQVLGVNAATLDSAGALRKAYLTTSVKVHPDKNPHPDATAAFQRVAEAWNTLSDDSARAAYDAELRYSSSSSSGAAGATGFGGATGTGGTTQYAYDFERTHMPSFQEALFMFAAATSMFSGSGGGGSAAAGASTGRGAFNVASDFVETLFWAQKLAEGRQKDTTQNNMDPNDPEFYNNDNNMNRSSSANTAESVGQSAANNPMASGMAFGSGLRAVAATQRMMGFQKGAAATEKAARTVQMAAAGAAVLKAANEVPAVQRTLERGKSTWQNNPQIGKGLRASLKFAGKVVHTLHEAQQQQAQEQQAQQQQSNGSGHQRY